MKLVSIIVPNYNNAKYLPSCLDSIFASNSENFEVIVVDDGSTDNSLYVLEQYTDFRLKVIAQENKGVSVSRNVGLQHSSGRYILFCDADDCYEPLAVDFIINFLESGTSESDLILFDRYIKKNGIKKVTDKIDSKKITSISALLYGLYSIPRYSSLWDKVYSADIIKENQIEFPQNIKTGEDNIFNIIYTSHCNSLCIINIPLYVYNYGISDFSSAKMNSPFVRLLQLSDTAKIRENLIDVIIERQPMLNRRDLTLAHQKYIKTTLFRILKRTSKEKQIETKAAIKSNPCFSTAISSSVFNADNIMDFFRFCLFKIYIH